jgi:prepilin peptidase CpaA
MGADDLLLLVLMPIILASAVSDLRSLRIPNLHVLVALGLFALLAPIAVDWPELALRLQIAAITFAIGFALFALRLIGGGDVKMMAVVLLYVPSEDVIIFLRLFAIALGAASVGALVIQRAPVFRRLGWSSVHTPRHVPVGVAIAAAVVVLALSSVGAMVSDG